MRRALGVLSAVLGACVLGAAPALANENGPELVCPDGVGSYSLYSGWNLPPSTVGDRMWACQYYVYEGGEPTGYPLEVRVDWSESATSDATWACSTAEDSDTTVVSGTRAAVAWWDLAGYDEAPPPESQLAAEELLRQASPLAIPCADLVATADPDVVPGDGSDASGSATGTGSGSATPPTESDESGGVPVAPVAGGVLGGLLFLLFVVGYNHRFRTPRPPVPTSDAQPLGVGFSDTVATLGVLSAVDEAAGLPGTGGMALDDFFEKSPPRTPAPPRPAGSAEPE